MSRGGDVEGAECARGGCEGLMQLEPQAPDDDCTCFLIAPCWWCLSQLVVCDRCGEIAEDDLSPNLE